MTPTTFDALAYFKKLKAAGVPEEQAKVQANALKGFAESQDAKNFRELATKGDIAEVNARLRETELRLQKEIKDAEMRLLKWQIGGWIVLATIMAKDFGRVGF